MSLLTTFVPSFAGSDETMQNLPAELPLDQRIWIAARARSILASKDRIVGEIVKMSVECEEILEALTAELGQSLGGAAFKHYALTTLKITRQTLHRYHRIGRTTRALLAGTDFPIDLQLISQKITNAALTILDGAEDEILLEVRELATQGVKVDEGLARKLLDTKADAERRLGEAQERIDAAQEQIDVQIARADAAERKATNLQNEVNSSFRRETQIEKIAVGQREQYEGLVSRFEKLTEENFLLRTQLESKIPIKEIVEVVPEGFLSTEEAIRTQRKVLENINIDIKARQAEAAASEEERVKRLAAIMESESIDGMAVRLSGTAEHLIKDWAAALLISDVTLTKDASDLIQKRVADIELLIARIRKEVL